MRDECLERSRSALPQVIQVLHPSAHHRKLTFVGIKTSLYFWIVKTEQEPQQMQIYSNYFLFLIIQVNFIHLRYVKQLLYNTTVKKLSIHQTQKNTVVKIMTNFDRILKT